MYSIFHTERADKEIQKYLSLEEREIFQKFENTYLKTNPFIGKPLSYPFFREKKIEGKRVYFLIYEQFNSVLVIAASDKKMQNDRIKEIKNDLKTYKELAEKLSKRA